MNNWRFVDLDLTELPTVHAMEETIAEKRDNNTLLLWRVNKPYLTLGYFQNVYEEVDVAQAKALGIPVIRRIGSGGAGYLNSSVLAYSLIVDERSTSMQKNVKKAYEVICNGVVLGVKELGLDATFVPTNDVLKSEKNSQGVLNSEATEWLYNMGSYLQT